MKKYLGIILLGIASIVFASSASAVSPVNGHVIFIDAGHGGSDGGSLACRDYPEKVANLDIAQRLKELLENNGADVHMSREGDETLSNRDRYESANSTNAEVLLSIHLNGSTDPQVNGNLGLYGKKNKDQAFTEIMQAEMPAALNVDDLGVTNFASGVLLKSRMPATIQETVFISNADECIALRDGDGTRQQEIAQALFAGLENWFSQAGGGDGGNDDGSSDPNCPPNSNNPKCQ